MPGAQQLGPAGQAQQREQAACREPFAGAELEWAVQLTKQRRPQRNVVDRARAVHHELGVAVRLGTALDTRRDSGIPWHARMIDGAAGCHHHRTVAA